MRNGSSASALVLLVAAAGCDPDPVVPAPDAGGADASAPAGFEVRPGDGIGPVRVGTRYSEVREALGPLEGAFASNRLAFGRYNALGLEVVLVSAEDGSVSDDAIVIGVGALAAEGFHGPVVPGMSRAALETDYGPPDDEASDTDFYREGFSVEYDGDTVLKVGVFRAYEHAPEPPPMRPAATRTSTP